MTLALLPGSPALNKGDPAQLGQADQRGVVRSGGVNIGAYQASASQFLVGAPAQVTAGVQFDVTVTAEDEFNQVAVGYIGTVAFSSTDTYPAVLPDGYTFTPADGGVHTFTAATALFTAGSQTITVSDTASGINGAATVLVTPAPADHFALAAPPQVAVGTPFDVTVTALDPYGNTDTNYQGTVTFSPSDTAPGVVVPPNYTFTSSDQGMHTFAGGVTLITPGSQTVTATDTVSSITGQ